MFRSGSLRNEPNQYGRNIAEQPSGCMNLCRREKVLQPPQHRFTAQEVHESKVRHAQELLHGLRKFHVFVYAGDDRKALQACCAPVYQGHAWRLWAQRLELRRTLGLRHSTALFAFIVAQSRQGTSETIAEGLPGARDLR